MKGFIRSDKIFYISHDSLDSYQLGKNLEMRTADNTT